MGVVTGVATGVVIGAAAGTAVGVTGGAALGAAAVVVTGAEVLAANKESGTQMHAAVTANNSEVVTTD
jgi:hypothetical protein